MNDVTTWQQIPFAGTFKAASSTHLVRRVAFMAQPLTLMPFSRMSFPHLVRSNWRNRAKSSSEPIGPGSLPRSIMSFRTLGCCKALLNSTLISLTSPADQGLRPELGENGRTVEGSEL